MWTYGVISILLAIICIYYFRLAHEVKCYSKADGAHEELVCDFITFIKENGLRKKHADKLEELQCQLDANHRRW